MSKIGIIIKREYLTRVVKKSFIIMTIIGPILMAGLMIGPAYLAKMDEEGAKKVLVIDQTDAFSKYRLNNTYLTNYRLKADSVAFDSSKISVRRLPDSDNISFHFLDKDMSLSEGKEMLQGEDFYALLFIPKNLVKQPLLELYSKKESNRSITSYVEAKLEKEIQNEKLRIKGVDPDVLQSTKTELEIITKVIQEDGEEKESFTAVTMVLGVAGGFLIYIFIFMYGSQVMRGVIEEKTNRIIEVIISSVKPFDLMMGKIVGVAMVGLTQFLLWVVLTFGIVTAVSTVFLDNPEQVMTSQSSSIMGDSQEVSAPMSMEEDGMKSFVDQIDKFINSVNWVLILGSFMFYFLGGYLLYAALFAAIGSAVDAEADTQQFMMPVTIPLILGIVMMQTVLENPDGMLAFWGSIIPLTSPIVMMMRVPFGVPVWELALSMGLLVLAFLFFTWLSAKIYRVGILMYGKKVNYKELWKWIRHH